MIILRIDAYYDVGCDVCGKHASTDYNTGMFQSRKAAENWAKKEGWMVMQGLNICLKCAQRKHSNNYV